MSNKKRTTERIMAFAFRRVARKDSIKLFGSSHGLYAGCNADFSFFHFVRNWKLDRFPLIISTEIALHVPFCRTIDTLQRRSELDERKTIYRGEERKYLSTAASDPSGSSIFYTNSPRDKSGFNVEIIFCQELVTIRI